MQLPIEFENKMKELIGNEYDAYLLSLNNPPKSGLRINNLKTDTDAFLKLNDEKLRKIPWVDNGFFIDSEKSYSKHPYYYAGLYYIQEPSAMTPASLLGTKPGERILDICAAPGGKSTQIGADLSGKGILISNDISASRAKALLKNIELFGIGNSCVTTESPEKLSEVYTEYFDRILIDAPCSGEGMFRKSPGILKYYMEKGPDYYAQLQKTIINIAALMLKPGGTMVYSTCTFGRIEDEDIILSFLDEHQDFEIDNISMREGYTKSDILPGSIRMFPHKCEGEGHFICRLKRSGTKQDNLYTTISSRYKLPDFVKEFLKRIDKPWDEDRFYTNKDYLFYLPKGYNIEKGLRYLRTGLFVGIIKNSRFEPSQALAMNLRASEWDNPLNISINDDRIYRYLKGETLQADDEYKGYRLVCVDNYPIGWIKQDGLRCKNKYLSGWRWM